MQAGRSLFFMGEAEEVGSNFDSGLDFEPTDEERPRVLLRDPVCGTEVDPEGAPARSVYRAITYFFCTHACRIEFESDPASYVG
jgi:YHS domain-containing protein